MDQHCPIIIVLICLSGNDFYVLHKKQQILSYKNCHVQEKLFCPIQKAMKHQIKKSKKNSRKSIKSKEKKKKIHIRNYI